MHNELFAAALGLADPWFVAGLDFEKSGTRQRLTIRIDFRPKSRFAVEGGGPEHPVHDTRVKRYQHLDFFQHECELAVRVPRVRRPDGRVVLVPPSWAGRLRGFTLLFEAMILLLCREMPFAAVARLTGLSWHKVRAICSRYVDQAVEQADYSEVRSLAIDETSRARGHDYVSLFAHPSERRVLFVAEGRRADTVAQFAEDLTRHGGDPARIASVSIDMSRAFIKGVSEHFPDARITFDSSMSSPMPPRPSTRPAGSSSAPTPTSRASAGPSSRAATPSLRNRRPTSINSSPAPPASALLAPGSTASNSAKS